MGGHFLQLRDQGCQGAWKIFTRAREVCQSAPPADKAEDSLSVALSIASGREDAMETWGKSIALAGCVQTDNLLQADIIVGEGIPQEELLRMSGRGNSPTIINGGNEIASPCRVLGDLLALTRKYGHDADRIDRIRISWLGNASGEFAGLADSWLESCLCFRHEFFMSFPPGGELRSGLLDFAMSAGGKIFLSHDPEVAVDGAHGVVLVPWRADDSSLSPRHPLLMEGAVREKARSELGEALLFSFLPDVNPTAWEEERRTCLIACQAALLEYMAALRKHSAA